MEKTTITVEILESSFLGQCKFREEGIMNKLRKAGIPARLADVTRELFVTDGTLTHNYNVAEGVITFYWTGDVSAIVEDTPKPCNTGTMPYASPVIKAILDGLTQERYELGQLLRKVEPCVAAEIQKYELMESFGCRGDTTKTRLTELKALRIQLDAMINNLSKEKP